MKPESKALAALRGELGGSLPDGIETLGAARLGEFTETLRQAKRRQQSVIEESLQGALSHLPALLRGTVRKLFDA